jgi:hypothetical protein
VQCGLRLWLLHTDRALMDGFDLITKNAGVWRLSLKSDKRSLVGRKSDKITLSSKDFHVVLPCYSLLWDGVLGVLLLCQKKVRRLILLYDHFHAWLVCDGYDLASHLDLLETP